MSPSLTSIFLVCSNLHSSLNFYQGLGFALKTRKSRSFVLSAGRDLELHLHDRLTPEEQQRFQVAGGASGTNLVHSFLVERLDSVRERVPSECVLFGPEVTDWGQRLLLVKDPDGHRLEFRERDPAQ